MHDSSRFREIRLSRDVAALWRIASGNRKPRGRAASSSLNPDCDDDRYSSTFGAILDRTMSDSVFLCTESKTIGRRLVSGPVGLPGFF